MKLSIVVPAFNEEAVIGGCLDAIAESVRLAAVGRETETVVVDNNCTDSTAEIARARGARVVFEPVNRISKSRNAGGRAARGEWILFIDADSRLSPELLSQLVRRMEDPGVAAGGALMRFDRAPWIGRLFTIVHLACAPLGGFCAGPCMFIRKEAFDAIGGFREELHAAEELWFCRDAAAWARRRGRRFVVVTRPNIVTSGRRFRINSFGEIFRSVAAAAVNPRSAEGCSLWYDGRR